MRLTCSSKRFWNVIPRQIKNDVTCNFEHSKRPQYDYSQYDFAEFGLPEGIDADTPAVEFVLHSDKTLNHVHLFNLSPVSWDDETGDTVYDATLEHIQYQVDPGHPLSVKTVIWGDAPNLAVGYADEDGTYHFVFVEISGEDGSLLLREF